MLPIVTYTDYHANGGTLSEGAFKTSLGAARAWVRYLVGYSNPSTDTEDAACVRAICAAIDIDAAYGGTGGVGEGISSMTVGSFSVSANNSFASTYQSDMERAIRHELTGTNLLFQGLGS